MSTFPAFSSNLEFLFAGKPIPFGPKNSHSSIIKTKHAHLNIRYDGALEDEQGNKKLHGGPYMALHQYSQEAYTLLKRAFPDTLQAIDIGTIGENISAPNMNEDNVFIGDQYKIGEAIIQVVSPRAPCSRINQRYGQRKIDLYIAQQGITGWYYSVIQEGRISVGDNIDLISREADPISVKQVWALRQLKTHTEHDSNKYLTLAKDAFQLGSLSPEWQAYMQRVYNKLSK